VKLGCSIAALTILGLVGCGGTQGSTTTSPTTLAQLQIAPAGVSLIGLLNIDFVRPDALVGVNPLPTCCVPSTSGAAGTIDTVTFGTNSTCNAGDGRPLTGTITISPALPTNPAPISGAYTLTYNLKVTGNKPPLTTNQTWTYTGTQTLTFTGPGTGTLTNSGQGITATYTDASQPANNATWTVTCALDCDWATPGAPTLGGNFIFNRAAAAGAAALTVTTDIAPDLAWVNDCNYPEAGVITQHFTGFSDVVFTFDNNQCGSVTLQNPNQNYVLGQ